MRYFFFGILDIILILILIKFKGVVKIAQKRPATSPAPMMHNQPAAHQSNVNNSFSIVFHYLFK